MKLVIFDIDGTLLDSTDVDAECYVRSIADVFGIAGMSDDWSEYTSATDRAIFDDVVQRNLGRPPTDEERAKHIERLIELFSVAVTDDPARFAEIPGARDIIAGMRGRDGWVVAIATGCWLESAEFKLRAGRIDHSGITMVTSTDEGMRDRLVGRCIETARSRAGVRAFDAIVSIGDGRWDVEVASRLGIGFIGVGSDPRSIFRRKERCTVIDRYPDVDSFVQLLETAAVPGRE